MLSGASTYRSAAHRFLGSEGETSVIVRHLDEYLCLLGGGVGPSEALEYLYIDASANPAFTAFDNKHSATQES